MEEKGEAPKISAVIPTYNSASTLKECLKSIQKQTYEQIEVIVVDNYSEDETAEIAKKFGARLISRKAGRAEARNIGIRNAKGKIIFSIDSDMRLREDVVEEGVKKIEEGYDAVIVPEVSIGEGFWTGVKWLKKWLHLGDLLYESPRIFRREVLEEVGFFDPSLVDAEEYDLHLRIREEGFQIGYISAIIEHIEGYLTLSEWLQEKYRYGQTTDRFKEKHSEIYKKKGSRRYPSFLLNNWEKLMEFPHFAFGLMIYKFCLLLPWKFKIPPKYLFSLKK